MKISNSCQKLKVNSTEAARNKCEKCNKNWLTLCLFTYMTLKGDRGATGEKGKKGEKGDVGDPGLSGEPVSHSVFSHLFS